MKVLKPVVAVFDSAVQGFASPILVAAKGQAVRSFQDEVNRADQNNPLFNHPEDFELRCLAMFDEETGVYHNMPDGPEVLCRGKDVKQK